MSNDHFDVLIVGAGLSGIGAAWHLQSRLPGHSYAILEGRARLGGTWDLFRYPGIRSDSDMHTLGYRFRPWTGARAIADGESIRQYVADTAREAGIDRRIRYDHRVVAADWSSADARWRLTVETPDGRRDFSCNFLWLCAGYYDFDRGHAPAFAGSEAFAGRIVHPQHWPQDLDYAGKRVAVIGSGATAMTLVPAMAAAGAQVTMVQRSPTYVVSRPGSDALADRLRNWLPERAAYRVTRWKNVLLGMLFYRLARGRPARVKLRLIGLVRDQLGRDYDVATHFTPRYDPWDQRVCLVPDGDLFAALRDGRAAMATGQIDRFDRDGIRLTDGRHVPADVIVTATGLEIRLFGGIALTVDGTPCDPARETIYRGMMLSNVPNLAFVFGYTNASWTLKADLVSGYVCRLLARMRRRDTPIVVPRLDPARVSPSPFVGFTSGYITRAADRLPTQGDRSPWRLHQNYLLDLLALRFGKADTALEFRRAANR